mgnify:CR=1 FL=1
MSSILASTPGMSFFWMRIAFGLLVVGCVLFVIALGRWKAGPGKYLWLGLFVVPLVPGIAGWVALFTGRLRQQGPSEPGPTAGPGPDPTLSSRPSR